VLECVGEKLSLLLPLAFEFVIDSQKNAGKGVVT
jgi:hypothetical protein